MMDVNPSNNNSEPWPSAIPQQMPWMAAPAGQTVASLQFGQMQPHEASSHLVPASSASVEQIASTPNSFSQVSNLAGSQAQDSATSFTSSLPGNPFDPNLVGQTLISPQSQLLQQPNVVSHSSALLHSQTSLEPQRAAGLEFGFGSSLTPMPLMSSAEAFQAVKRNSVEMEDELITIEEPPTKMQLSENKLFQRFGSLQLSGEDCQQDYVEEADGNQSDSSDDDRHESSNYGREAFNRYVYLLFKDKNNKGGSFGSATSGAMERLLREERDKLNKAVILWSPPPKNSFQNSHTDDTSDDDDDTNLTYTDHKDFLRNKPPTSANDSLTITEITNEACEDLIMETNSSPIEPDDIMLDD